MALVQGRPRAGVRIRRMPRVGCDRRFSRRWIAAAGLCIVVPLAAMGLRGALWRGSDDARIGDRHVEALIVSDSVKPVAVSVETTWERRHGSPALASGTSPTAADETVVIPPKESAELALMAEALRLVDQGRKRYATIRDYTCLFTKRERMANGRMVGPHVLSMKVRTQPRAIYFKFLKAHAGREAIWIDGQFDGKMLVHDVGLGKLLAGTMRIEPRSPMAMDENRHPITEAGVGFLLEELATYWAIEMQPGKIDVQIAHDAQVGDRPCILVVSRHPDFAPEYRNHKVKVYFDRDLSLPIRFEAYDWPNTQGKVELLEEYTYVDLKIDPGLAESDFDPANPMYSFGRF